MDLSILSEEQILQQRVCDFALKIQGTWIEECIHELYSELEEKQIFFRPQCYLSDEWLTPDKEPIVGIPFYLAHPSLIKIEKKMMYEAEGGTKSSCMRLLRHETGHAINYAYNLYRKKRWRAVFGSMSDPYEDSYRFQAYSKNFVHHLEDYYAQCHPDEDFAETFAVWLTPHYDWKTEYAGWGAYDKLVYVDELMNSLKAVAPLRDSGKRYWEARTMRIKLSTYYKRKRKHYAEDFPDFHDSYLFEIFVEQRLSATIPVNKNKEISAAYFMQKHKRQIINILAHMTDEKKYILNELVRSIMNRCKKLQLVLKDKHEITVMRITAYLTTIIMNKRYTGKYRGK